MLILKTYKLKKIFSVLMFSSMIFSLSSCDDEVDDFTATPVILSFSPEVTAPNAIISIVGGNFNSEPSLNSVKFTSALGANDSFIIDLESDILQAHENALSVKVPLGAITGPITVTVNNVKGTSNILTIIQPDLVITSINPISANRGDAVIINGQDFSETIAENIVTFGTVEATLVSASSTALEVIVPEAAEVGATVVNVSVTTIQQNASFDFEITDTTAVGVTSYSQPSGSIGSEITIFGANFSPVASENTVTFNDLNTVVTSATNTSLVVAIPEGATDGPINVTVEGKMASGPVFYVVFAFSESDSSVTDLDLLKVFWLNDTVVYIVGDDGTLLKSSDSGASWTHNSVIQDMAGTDDLYYSFFVDETTGWVSSRSGKIYRTNDAGASWTVWEDDDLTKSEEIRSIIFVDANNGWASGDNGIIIHTTDGGLNWELQAATFDSGTYTYTYDTLDFDSIFFINDTTGWAVAEKGTILTTSDGGATWVDRTDATLQSLEIDLKRVFFTDANIGWIGGEQSTILKSSDGGTSWNPVIVSGDLPADIDINDLTIVDQNLMIAVTDDSGLIQSFDGGETFVSSLLSTTIISDSTMDLEGISVSPNGSVIAVGDDGTLIK